MNGSQDQPISLDAEELLHLAIKASERGDHDSAITYLKRAIEAAPDNGRAYYMLGAEHAEIGMFDRAISDMQRAVELGVSLPTAHFQLGLLHITSGRPQEAIEAWKPLDELAPEHPLYLFKTALTHLANDEFAQCAAMLKKGIDANVEYEALNRDMRGILEQVEPLIGDAEPAGTGIPEKADASRGHILLSAYKNDDDQPDTQ